MIIRIVKPEAEVLAYETGLLSDTGKYAVEDTMEISLYEWANWLDEKGIEDMNSREAAIYLDKFIRFKLEDK